jgi:hypothetical protein
MCVEAEGIVEAEAAAEARKASRRVSSRDREEEEEERADFVCGVWADEVGAFGA